jgi:hypothetical protein
MPEKPGPEPTEPVAGEEVSLRRIGDEPPPGSGAQELAKAFRLNAEILRRIQETQQDIARTLERSDRSDMVIRSADALNETFRGVRSTQKALLERIEETRSRHGRTLLVVGAAAIVAVALLVLGARWLVERTQEETRREVAEAWREDRKARDDALGTAAGLRDEVEAARRRATSRPRGRRSAASRGGSRRSSRCPVSSTRCGPTSGSGRTGWRSGTPASWRSTRRTSGSGGSRASSPRSSRRPSRRSGI